jgi:hypothetical protein
MDSLRWFRWCPTGVDCRHRVVLFVVDRPVNRMVPLDDDSAGLCVMVLEPWSLFDSGITGHYRL